MNAISPWARQIEKATNDKLRVELFYSETLAKDKKVWETTKSDIADILWCFHGYWAGVTPLTDVISLPALPFKSAEKGSEVLWKLYENFPPIQKEFSDNKVLLLFTSTPYILITGKKQVKTVAETLGLKICKKQAHPNEMMANRPGTSKMTFENYMTLRNGTIDGFGRDWESIYGFRWNEMANYYTQIPFPAVYFSISMNKRKWDGLGKEIQDAILSVSGLEGSKFWGRNFFDTPKDGVLEQAQSNGKRIEVYSLPGSERQRWLETSGKPIWQQWVNKMKNKGYENAQEILDAAISFCKE